MITVTKLVSDAVTVVLVSSVEIRSGVSLRRHMIMVELLSVVQKWLGGIHTKGPNYIGILGNPGFHLGIGLRFGQVSAHTVLTGDTVTTGEVNYEHD